LRDAHDADSLGFRAKFLEDEERGIKEGMEREKKLIKT
jgi:hypothetical protein